MSVNQHYRRAWVQTIFAQAVALFHETRKEPINADVPLADLARQCANTVFAANANTIVGDKEICAREFMAYCADHFTKELITAVGERAQAEIAAHQTQEARVS